jgi:outer membrane lipoprotein-sorting protein
MRKFQFPVALAGAALLLAACGKQAVTQTRPIAVDPGPAPTIVTLPAPAVGPATDAAHEALVKAIAAFKAMPAYTAKMAFMQKNGSNAVKGVYDLAGKQPRTLKLFVESGTGEGTKLLWQGGEKVKVRPAGILSAVTVDLPQDDERLKSVRGYVLSDTDIPAMFTCLQDPANTLSGPDQTADGLVLHAKGHKFPRGVVAMNGVFDPVTMLPRKVEMMDSKEVVLRFVITGMTRKPDISLSI